MDNVVEVRLNGVKYAYWQQVSIHTSIDDLATSVDLGLTTTGDDNHIKLDANSVAQIYLNNLLISTVRADILTRNVDADSHTVRFSARSLARELIDCQYSITLKKMMLGEIVKRICTLFKVPLNAPKTTPLVPDFSMQAESPANAILNAARAGNVLIYSLPDGGLKIAEPDNNAPVATLVLGDNIKSYAVTDEYRLRFSEYYVKSFDYAANTSRKGVMIDAGLSYFRPMHIVADRHGNALGALQRRAELERNRRLARAHRIELTLVGWGHETAGNWQPWQINTQVRVVIPTENIDSVMLIGDLHFSQDDKQGTLTHMTVMHRNAFVGIAEQSKKKSAAKRKAKKVVKYDQSNLE